MNLLSAIEDLSSTDREVANRAAAFAGNLGKQGRPLLPLLEQYCIQRVTDDLRFAEQNFLALISIARIIREVDSSNDHSSDIDSCINMLLEFLVADDMRLFHVSANALSIIKERAQRAIPLLLALYSKYQSNDLAKLRIYQSLNSISPESISESLRKECSEIPHFEDWVKTG